jgi:aspartyl-tRNA(Asn)/glutamyl-tRNA(Gln) amidotransferase subunit A
MQNFFSALQQIDVIVTPSLPITAWEQKQATVVINGEQESALGASWRLTFPFNLTGLPAISLPCGFDRRGLPIGLQMAAKPFDEVTLLRLAHAYENIHRWGERMPPLQPVPADPN